MAHRELTHLLVALDPGNGTWNIRISGKGATVVAGYSTAEPSGKISTSTGSELKAKAFPVSYADQTFWFGPDVLRSSDLIRGINEAKLNDTYLRTMFAGALSAWAKQHKISHDVLDSLPLHIHALMPAQMYQGNSKNQYTRAFSSAFTHNVGFWIEYEYKRLSKKVQIMPQFKAMHPESIVYYQSIASSVKAEYSVIVDMGLGTFDILIFKRGATAPIRTSSLNEGILNALQNQPDINLAENELFSGELKLPAYFNQRLQKLQAATGPIIGKAEYHVIGGAVNLMDAADKSQWQDVLKSVMWGDQYSNVTALSNAIKAVS